MCTVESVAGDFARLAVPSLIQGNHPVFVRGSVDLILLIGAVATPAMQKDEGRVAFTMDFAGDGEPVGCANGALGRVFITFTRDRRQNQ